MSDVMTETSTLQGQLLAVADVLQARGRCQNRLVAEDGRVRLLMAICEVVKDTEVPRVRTMIKALQHEIGKVNITTWNDAPGRTDDEVLAMIRRAATRVAS